MIKLTDILNESYNPNVYQIECRVVMGAGNRPIQDIISDIRAIPGVTVVDTIESDYNTDEGRHVTDLSIKVDPSPFNPFDRNSYIKILNDIKKLPDVRGAKYISAPIVIENKLQKLIKEVLQKKKRDRCLRIADRKYDKPSAYKSGAVVRCRNGEIWKDLKETDDPQSGKAAPYGSGYAKVKEAIQKILKEKTKLNIQDLAYKQIPGLLEKGIKNELKFLSNKINMSFEDIKNTTKPQIKRVPLSSIEPSQYGEDYENPSSEYEAEEFEKILNGEKDVKNHREEDFNPILVDKNTNKIIDGNHRHYALSTIGSPYAVVLFVDVPKEYLNEAKKETLRTWFKRKGAPGKEGGWVDCNAPIRKDGKITGYKTCGRKKGEKRAKYPSCRPTAAQCKTPGKGTKWGKTK